MQRIGYLAILLVAIAFLFILPIDVLATGEVASFKFEEDTRAPDIALVSGDVYAIVYDNRDNDRGTLITISIDSAGKIGSVIDTCDFDTGGDIFEPEIIQVDSDTYAIVYLGGSDADAVSIKTLDISTVGSITCSTTNFAVDADAEDNDAGPEIIQVDTETFAVIYENESDILFYFTEDISNTGAFSSPSGGPTSASIGSGFADPQITSVDSDTFVFAYSNTGATDGRITTIDIAADGSVSSGETATFVTGGTEPANPKISAIDSDTFGVIYQDGENNFSPILKTFDISATGDIAGTTTATITATKTLDTGAGSTPEMISVDSDTFAIVYCNSVGNSAFKTIDIAADGTIASAFTDDLLITLGENHVPKIIKISSTLFAVVHGGDTTGDGILRTITIAATTTTTKSSSGGDTSPPTLGKSSTGRQVVENGFSYQSNQGGFFQSDVDLGLTHMDSLPVGVGGFPEAPPGEIRDDTREKLNERGLGDVAKTFDNLSDAIKTLDDFFNQPPPDEQPDQTPPEPRDIPDMLDNLRQGLDQSRVDPNSHSNPERAAQINNLLSQIEQKIREIENNIPAE